MIKNINQGPCIVVNRQTHYPYISSSASNSLGAGNVRYNFNLQELEAYDGSQWVTIPSPTVDISLDYETMNILNWAKEKMLEERRLAELSKTSIAIKNAIDTLNKAKTQLETTIILSKEHINETTY